MCFPAFVPCFAHRHRAIGLYCNILAKWPMFISDEFALQMCARVRLHWEFNNSIKMKRLCAPHTNTTAINIVRSPNVSQIVFHISVLQSICRAANVQTLSRHCSCCRTTKKTLREKSWRFCTLNCRYRWLLDNVTKCFQQIQLHLKRFVHARNRCSCSAIIWTKTTMI